MSGNELRKLLTKLRILTRSKNEGGEDLELSMEVYREQMEKYPADVARHVLTTQPEMSTWWPSWNELRDRLELYAGKRRRVAQALENALVNVPRQS